MGLLAAPFSTQSSSTCHWGRTSALPRASATRATCRTFCRSLQQCAVLPARYRKHGGVPSGSVGLSPLDKKLPGSGRTTQATRRVLSGKAGCSGSWHRREVCPYQPSLRLKPPPTTRLHGPRLLPKRKRRERKDHHSLEAYAFLEKERQPPRLQRGRRPASQRQDVACPRCAVWEGLSPLWSSTRVPRTSPSGSDRPWRRLPEKLGRSAKCEVGPGLRTTPGGQSLASGKGPTLLPWSGQKPRGDPRGWQQGKLSEGYRSPRHHLCNFSANPKSLQSKKVIKTKK